MEQIIQLIGLIVAVLFILFSLDDLFWDVFSIVRSIRYGGTGRLPIEHLDQAPPKLLAVMVAAWHEGNVIGPVIDNMLASVQYPRSMYHVFIGVYPNDESTIDAARKLEQKYENVHIVVNTRQGPTCKADNLNSIIRHIKQFEQDRRWRFSSVTVHDSEDVVHPYELKLTNYLIDDYAVLQFPVIPLQKMPSLRHAFQGMTTGTYADEFAENHYRTMGIREAMSAVVPSAGTGFAISHTILEDYGDEPLFPEDSLTEDYKLSLTLSKQGYKIHYVLEKIPRLTDSDTVRWDYVATRSFFPDTFRTAVRQKTRWIYGITMQTVNISDFFRRSSLSITGRYSLYRDLKAKISNLMVLPGYLVFLYFILSLFVAVPVMYPWQSLAWHLCVVLTILMIFRQLMRAISIINFYGFKSMAISCLLPPLLPIRLVWGNIINMSATFCAWKQYFLGTGKNKKKKKVVWNKTDHTFLNENVLYRYYRHVGDVLLEKQYIDVSTLSDALRQSRGTGTRLGDVLLRQDIVSEEQLMEAVSNVQHRPFATNILQQDKTIFSRIDRDLFRELLVCPLFEANGAYVFAVTDFSPIEELPGQLGIPAEVLRYVYTTKSSVLEAINRHNSQEDPDSGRIGALLRRGRITWEQAVLAHDRRDTSRDILCYMGLEPCAQVQELVTVSPDLFMMEAGVIWY